MLRMIRRLLMTAYPRWMRFGWMRRLNYLLFELSLRGFGLLNYESTARSGEDHFIRRVLPRVITDGQPVMLDVGANEGHYSETLKAAFPGARVIAFEPHPATYQRLVQTAARRFETEPLGLGSCSGKMDIFDYADQQGSQHASLHRGVIEQLGSAVSQSWKVEVSTLDRYCETAGIRQVHFLKIDTEGNELEVLKGAQGLLRERRIDVIQFEFNEMNVVGRVFLKDIIEQLQGFELFRLLPNGLLRLKGYKPALHEIFAFQNIVAVRRDGGSPVADLPCVGEV